MLDLTAADFTDAELETMQTKARYQPYRLPKGIVTGAGLSFFRRTDLRSTYPGDTHPDAPLFLSGAERQARMYDEMISFVAEHVEVKGATYLDACCNSGYFPFSLSRLGAKATGVDFDDFSETFALANRALGTTAEFIRDAYDMQRHTFPALAGREFDIVSNIAFICHDSDPTFLVSELASKARKALLLFSLFPRSDEFFIKYGTEPKKYWKAPFPVCFDNGVQVSDSLLLYGLKDLGFPTVLEVPRNPDWPFRDMSWRAFLALR